MPIKEVNEKISITTPQQCHHQFDLLKTALSVDETEDTWLKIDASLKKFTAAIRGGACDFPDDFLRRWKESDIVRGIVSALSTERTRLSGTALDLIGSTSRLGSHWDSAIPFYIPTIVKLLARASKIYVTRASIALNTLIRGTRSASFIPLLLDGLSDKSISLRIGCADGLLCCLGGSPERDRDQLELIKEPTVTREGLNKRLVDIESAIKIGGRDRDPKVRAIFKRIWVLYQKQWPTRASALSQPFTPTIKRYLGLNKPAGSSNPPEDLQPTSSSSRAVPPSNNNKRATNERTTNTSQPSRPKEATNSLARSTNRSQSNASEQARSHGPTSSHHPVGSSDSATLRLAASVPLPLDHPLQPSQRQARQPVESRPLPTTSTFASHSMTESRSAAFKKRSNSTMRAQRVALPPPDPTTNSTTRTATRVPLNPIASTNHGPSDVFSKTTNLGHSNTTHKHLPSTHSHEINVSSSSEPIVPNRGFKPSRTASGSSQVAPSPTSHPVPTRPLPRRAIPESQESANLKKSVGASAKVVQQDTTGNPISQTGYRKAFKPSKSSKPALKTNPKSVPSRPLAPASSKPIPHTLVSGLPEELRIPALTPLPPSPALESNEAPVLSEPPLEPSVPSPASDEPQSEPIPTVLPKSLPSPPPPPPPPIGETPTLIVRSSPPIEEPSPPIEEPSPPIAALSPPIAEPSPPIVQPSDSHITATVSRSTDKAVAVSDAPKPPSSNICTRLPDDLIVPMSVPLPPSPNSPYLFKTSNPPTFAMSKPPKTPAFQKSNSSATPRRPYPAATPHRKPHATTSKTISKSEYHSSAHKTPMKTASLSQSLSATPERRGRSAIDPTASSTRSVSASGGPTQLLVDFDHEDTIWMPLPPKVNSDLAQLGLSFDFGRWKEEEEINQANEFQTDQQDNHEVDEDGPEDKKRMRLDNHNVVNENTHDNTVLENTLNTPIGIHHRGRPRDPTIFNWDRVTSPDGDEIDEEDSNDKTVSCLKEQPMFLGGDVTVNESFDHAEFLIGIQPKNQSTPADPTKNVVYRTQVGLGDLSLTE